jgi:membrane protein implicated in regulation of membrane protease activity
MIMQAWQIWMIIGIVCIVIEIFDPAFFFLSLGIAAIMTGLLSFAVKATALQIIIFAVLSFLAFLSMRKLGKKILSTPGSETNVYALKGKLGIVMKAIPEHGKGYVKIDSEEWSAIAKNNLTIELNARVSVVDVEGNKLIVERLSTETE